MVFFTCFQCVVNKLWLAEYLSCPFNGKIKGINR